MIRKKSDQSDSGNKEAQKPYTIFQKAAVFVSNFPPSCSRIAVAATGLFGNYSLSSELERKYAGIIVNSCTTLQLCGYLKQDCSDTVQEIFTEGIVEKFKLGLKALEDDIEKPTESGRPSIMSNGTARALGTLRSQIADILDKGHITSDKAQVTLAFLFHHHKIAEIFDAAHQPKQIRKVMRSEAVNGEVKMQILESVAKSNCKLCRSHLYID